MKYCQYCGNEVLDEAVICLKCGCSVDYDNKPQIKNRTALQENCSALSIVGFIFAFFESVIGLILSIVAYCKAKETGSEKSQSLSKAGIIVSSVFLGIEVIICIFVLAVCFYVAVSASVLNALF